MDAPKIEAQDGYVLVDLGTGYVATHEKPVGLIDLVNAAFAQAGARKVLMTGVDIRGEFSLVDLLDRVKSFSELRAKMAMVITHQGPAENIQFMEDASLLGETKMRFFESVDEAKRWLGVK